MAFLKGLLIFEDHFSFCLGFLSKSKVCFWVFFMFAPYTKGFLGAEENDTKCRCFGPLTLLKEPRNQQKKQKKHQKTTKKQHKKQKKQQKTKKTQKKTNRRGLYHELYSAEDVDLIIAMNVSWRPTNESPCQMKKNVLGLYWEFI